jgi:hypothetical protein
MIVTIIIISSLLLTSLYVNYNLFRKLEVLEEEIEKDDWIMWCKDPSQLDEVWEYYKKPY